MTQFVRDRHGVPGLVDDDRLLFERHSHDGLLDGDVAERSRLPRVVAIVHDEEVDRAGVVVAEEGRERRAVFPLFPFHHEREKASLVVEPALLALHRFAHLEDRTHSGSFPDGIDIVLDPQVEDARVTLKLTDVSVKSAIKLLLHPLGLVATIREDAIVVVPRSGVRRNVTLRVYDVRDLVFTLKDSPGPVVELKSEEPGIRIPPFPSEGRACFDENSTLEIVKSHIEWADGTSVVFANGMLMVVQTRAGHEEVSELLGRLRLFQ